MIARIIEVVLGERRALAVFSLRAADGRARFELLDIDAGPIR